MGHHGENQFEYEHGVERTKHMGVVGAVEYKCVCATNPEVHTEHQEEPVIFVPHTVSCEHAMVVSLQNANLTDGAVVGPGWSV